MNKNLRYRVQSSRVWFGCEVQEQDVSYVKDSQVIVEEETAYVRGRWEEWGGKLSADVRPVERGEA